MASEDEKIAAFCAVTGCADAAKAAFHLESCGGDVDAAVGAFYEAGDEPASAPAPAPAAAAPTPATVASASASAPAARRARSSGAPSNVRGFGDVGGGGGDDDDDGEKPQEWYTGGAQSGSVVQDPKKPQSREDKLRAMLDGARAAGAVDGREEDLARGRPGGDGKKSVRGGAFTGASRSLNSDAPSDGGPVAGAAATPEPMTGAPAPQVHTITFWANGFTVDDGPLRNYDDPANTAFMQAVGRGECPRELEPTDRATPININLVKKETDYEPPPEPKYVAFSGSGRTLGGSSSSAAAAPPPPPQPASEIAPSEWSIDESAPSTSIQLRLRDGSRKVARFNLSHTVSDIRAYIAAAAPACASGEYTLQLAGFPPKRLTDGAMKIGDGGLASSVVIQR